MKQALFLSILFFSGYLAGAQKNELMVKGGENGLYLEHQVAPRESYFAIGRKYNVHPRFLASYNKLDINKGLQIDQRIRIPLTDTNFTQAKGSGTPVYYRVADKEGLLAVSRKHRNVTLANLRWWNNLTTDDLKKDSRLIVGFLQSSEFPSTTISGKPKADAAIVKTEPAQPEPRKEEPVPVAVKAEEKKEEPKPEPIRKEEEKKTAILSDPPPAKPDPASENGEGFFRNTFLQQQANTSVRHQDDVTAGIFKTLSGWQDGKYYVLADKVNPGTVVRISHPATGKSVYAKVLGEMAGIRQNQGLDIRISNAAAAVLGLGETDKFTVKIQY